jgi:peroxiredoxin
MNEYGEMVVLDSTDIQGDEFRFRGKVEYPTMYHVQISKRRPIDVFVENSYISIRGSFLLPEEIKVTGSQSFDELLYLQREAKKIQNEKNSILIELENARKQRNRKQVRELENRYKHYADTLLLITKQFVSNNPSSVGAAYFVCMLTHTFDIRRLREIIGLFDYSIRNSEYVQFLNDELILSQKLNLGSPAPDFAVPTSTGDIVRLSDYEGKHLLIKFWASWCKKGPGRNRELRELYSKYQQAGLEILSISLDKEEAEWKSGIERDSMEWRQASDLLYWESPVSKYYRVQRIPYEVLIDPNGKIIAADTKRQTMNAKMKNIFGF